MSRSANTATSSTSSRPPQSLSTDDHYKPHLESLTFEEAEVTFHLNSMHHVKLPNSVIICHHRLNDSTKSSLHQAESGYLHSVFKHYLDSLQKHPDGSASTQPAPPRNRTVFIAQFQGAQSKEKSQKNQPTYGVSYEFEVGLGGTTVILIGYRELSRASFLCTALGTWEKPVLDETTRPCLVLEAHSAKSDDKLSAAETAKLVNSCIGPYRLEPRLLSMRDALTSTTYFGSRILAVSRHGWLVVFLKNCPTAYILLDGEYLLVGPSMRDVPLVYKRTLDMNSARTESDELYFRQTILEQHPDSCTGGSQYCPGLVITQAVVHNEFEENTFAVLGAGNVALDFAYFQQIVTMADGGHGSESADASAGAATTSKAQ